MTPARHPDDYGSDGGLTPEQVADQFALIYDRLRRLAHKIREGGGGETLVTTALVHEAYLKLASSRELKVASREHFLAIAARAMRQIVVDAARRRRAGKRGGAQVAVTLDEAIAPAPMDTESVLALDEALARLEEIDPRRARIVEHRLFAGLTPEETAAVLGISRATVDRDWRAARAWLAMRLSSG